MTDEDLLQRINHIAAERWTTFDLRSERLGRRLTVLSPEIGQLSHLEYLHLNDNQLTALPPEIGRLVRLTRLHLEGNQLTALPPEIGRLVRLTRLHLNDNQLTVLPPEIGQLSGLTTGLWLSNNRLTALPPEIGQLARLQIFHLSDNRLTALPPEIGQLSRLMNLHLSHNELTALPPEIGRLSYLSSLFLNDNRLTALPPEIGQLSHLRLLWLDGNQLTTLPPELSRLKELKDLRVDGNPLTSPPPEVVGQGTPAILDYLRNLLESGTRQWVSKLLVVGEGGVGKTSLLRALRGEAFDPQLDSTPGIRIGTLALAHPNHADVTMTLNTWDFGGQEIYHATHQFFLTNRSLFLLAWNTRHGFEQGKLYYWLDTIKALAPDSPVLLVATWIDERDPDLPLSELRSRYPQIIGQCAISNKTGLGIEQLRRAIIGAAAELPLMGETWPTTWLSATKALHARPEKHITPHQLHRLMARHGVDDASAGVLVRWLHELGDVLYFPDNAELSNTVILKPHWVTEYISKVLTSKEVIERRGVFTRRHMDELWTVLDAGMRDHFLRLMERFDLSYRTLEDRDISLVVERLPFDPPNYAPLWEAMKLNDDCNEITMRFRLSTIPAGVPTWFIARSHRFTTNNHWRNGALFEDNRVDGKHLGLVRTFPHERYLELSVRGPAPQNFFALLKDGIEITLARFPGLDIRRMIPCPGHDGQPCEHEFDQALLVKRLQKHRLTIECPVSLEDVSVTDLLFGIDWSTQGSVLAAIERSKDKILTAVKDLRVANAKEHKQIASQIDELTILAQREFTNLFNREQRLIESHCPSIFVLRPRDLTGWQGWLQRVKSPLTGRFFDLQLYCQQPGYWHPTIEGGLYEIDEPAEWFQEVAPLLRGIAATLKYIAPLAGPAAAWAVPNFEVVYKVDIEFTKAIVEKLPEFKVHTESELAGQTGQHDDPDRVRGAALRALRLLLDAKDPQQRWGGLQKILTPEGHYLWLCEHHAKEYAR